MNNVAPFGADTDINSFRRAGRTGAINRRRWSLATRMTALGGSLKSRPTRGEGRLSWCNSLKAILATSDSTTQFAVICYRPSSGRYLFIDNAHTFRPPLATLAMQGRILCSWLGARRRRSDLVAGTLSCRIAVDRRDAAGARLEKSALSDGVNRLLTSLPRDQPLLPFLKPPGARRHLALIPATADYVLRACVVCD